MAKSPSITLLERDVSQFAVTTSETVLALVGYASKGPIDEVTKVTSMNEFITKFGTAPVDSPYSTLAVKRAFQQTNQLLFVRIANETSGDSNEALASERILGGVDDGIGSGDSAIKVLIKAKEKGSAFNGSYLIATTRANPITAGDTYYDLTFYYLGSGDTVETEKWENISFNNGDSDFFETRINADSDNGGSEWITVDTYAGTGDSNFSLPFDTAFILGKNTNGDSAFASGDTWSADDGDSIDYEYRAGTDGAITGDTAFTSQLATSADLANLELWDFHVLATPDKETQAVQDAAVTLCEYRKDAVYLADPPVGLAYDEVADWHNGAGSHGRTTALNTSYAATYWPWLKDFSDDTGEFLLAPPSVWIAAKWLEVDRNFAPWFAPAGEARGKLSAFDYETSPSFSQRETLYGDLNAVNPIVNFSSKGLIVFGQKTLLRTNSALNRVNVRRMIVYAKKLIKAALDSIVFEPHVPDSWARATNLINSILEPIRQGGGLDDYQVIIDDTTNTADLIAQSIMKGIIKLVPVGTIEIIELSIQIQSPGTTIS